MHVQVIDQFETFRSIRKNWDEVYEADPDATIFLSWEWLSRWLEELDETWFILGVKQTKDADKYVAFLPLRSKLMQTKSGQVYSEFAMAGSRFADYTGILCHPENAATAITTLGKAVRPMNWGVLRLDGFRAKDENLARFLSVFAGDRFECQKVSHVDRNTGIDLAACPYVELPDDWDAYLQKLSANMRQKLRRIVRKFDRDPSLHITEAKPETFDRDLEIFLEMWSARWAKNKKDRLGSINRNLRLMIRHCFENGLLHFPILWRGDTPIGAAANIIDARKKRMLFLAGARNQSVTDIQPGLLLHSHTIRHSIRRGIETYDFLRGDETYKYSFGCVDDTVSTIFVKANSSKMRSRKYLDRRNISDALKVGFSRLFEGQYKHAKTIFRQILSVENDLIAALCGHGHVCQLMGDKNAARTSFRAAEKIDPGSHSKHWMWVGHAMTTQRKWTAAEEAYSEALQCAPGSPEAHYHIGLVRMADTRPDHAIKLFNAALKANSGGVNVVNAPSTTLAPARD